MGILCKNCGIARLKKTIFSAFGHSMFATFTGPKVISSFTKLK